YPPKKAVAPNVLPPAKTWRKLNPDAAERLPIVRGTVRAHAQELQLPQENLLTPAYQRRLAWTGPEALSADGVAATLRQLGARDWQIEIVAEPLSRALRNPDSTPSAASPSATSPSA